MGSGNSVKIAIVDDREHDCAQTADMIADILHQSNIVHSISRYGDGVSFLESVRRGEKFQLIVLDVMMGELGGMELAAELRRQGSEVSIIFVSSNREMAMRGYEVAAARYLAKPLERERMEEALAFCLRQWQTKKEILLPTSRGQYRTSFSDIQYVEAIDRGTRFVLAGETVETKLKFGEVEALLPKTAFIHCHRSYIVNIAFTKRIGQYEFIMKSGESVPISRPRYSEVNRQFVEYFTD